MTSISRIQKRNGQTVAFDQNKITEAIWKAAQSVGGTDRTIAEKMSNQVSTVLEVFFKGENNNPTVEQIQDLVEKILIENGHAKTAKAYILYRNEHSKLREEKAKILGSNDSIIMTFPKNASMEDVKNIFNLAKKIGCTIIAGEKSAEKTDSNSPIIREHKALNKDQAALPFEEKNSKRKVIEEVIPPPLEIMK